MSSGWNNTLQTIRKIADVLANENKGEVNRLMADLIRVLVVYRGICWRSELFMDLAKLHNFLGRAETIDPYSLDTALSELKSRNVISLEDRMRGSILDEGTITDQLIQLTSLDDSRKALEKGKILREYLSERGRRILDAVRTRKRE